MTESESESPPRENKAADGSRLVQIVLIKGEICLFNLNWLSLSFQLWLALKPFPSVYHYYTVLIIVKPMFNIVSGARYKSFLLARTSATEATKPTKHAHLFLFHQIKRVAAWCWFVLKAWLYLPWAFHDIMPAHFNRECCPFYFSYIYLKSLVTFQSKILNATHS